MTLAMTPSEFAHAIVIPTVEEFRGDPTSRRRAYLAAVTVYHLRDHLGEAMAAPLLTGVSKLDRKAVEKAAGMVDDAIRAAVPGEAFDVVRGVANGSKHAITRSAHAVPFTAGSDWERPPAVFGEMQFGVSRFGDTAGGREIAHGDARLDLYAAVSATLLAFLDLYPGLLSGCSFTP